MRGFVAASAKGWRDAVANPAAAVAALKKRSIAHRREAGDREAQWLVKNQLTTDRVEGRRAGRRARRALRKRARYRSTAFELANKPKASDVFTAEFLPAAEVRKLP